MYTELEKKKSLTVEWLGAKFKNVETQGELSAAGLHDYNGALLIELPPASSAAKNALQKGDVIIKIDKSPVNSVSGLLQAYQSIRWMGTVECIVVRNQGEKKLMIDFKK